MSSKIRVFYNPLDASSEEVFETEQGVSVIDFLVEEFPSGFTGPVRIFAGQDELDPDDFDHVIREDEQITILVMPSGGIDIGVIVINALIAIAIGYVINLIFPVKTPGGVDQGDESPVYSIGATKNAARLGSPIPSIYGTVAWPPDYASAPYIFHSTNFVGGNDQFVDELLCLGHGKFEIMDVFVGNMNVKDLSPTAFQYWIFDSSEHLQTLGRIERLVDDATRGTFMPLPFYENLYTSPEVENYEFAPKTTKPSTIWTPLTGNAVAPTSVNLGALTNVPDTVNVAPGDTMTIRNSTSNNFTFTVDTVVTDPDTPGILTIFQTSNSTAFTDEAPLNAASEYQINTATIDNEGQLGDTRTAGPYRAQREDQSINMIWCDFIFPQGLFGRDGTDGDIKTEAVELGFKYQQIDPISGAAIGAPVERTDLFTSNQLNPYRRSTRSPELPAGSYEVTVNRRNPYNDERTTDLCQWVGLRGVVEHDPEALVYGDTTMMAVRMRATQGLGSAARERIRVKARRILGDDTEDSSNPIVVIKDIFLDPYYGLGRTEAELDTTKLDELQEAWDFPDGPHFNAAFDSKSTGFEAMEAAAALAASRVVQDGGLLTVVQDHIQDVRTALFSTANYTRDSLQILYTFDTDGEYDGMQVEYRDPDTFDPSYVYYNPYGDSQPLNPDTITLFGSTDKTYTEGMATYYWNIKARRRKQLTLETEKEGIIPVFGDRIGVSTPVPDWGQSGVFVSQIDATSWYVDQDLDWTTNNVMILRTDTGAGTAELPVTQGATPNIVVFNTDPGIVAGPELREPTNYMFGVTTNLVRDFIITKVSPKSDMTVSIEAQTYDTRIYTEGDPTPPQHMRNEGGFDCAAMSDWVAKPINAQRFLWLQRLYSPEDFANANNNQVDIENLGSRLDVMVIKASTDLAYQTNTNLYYNNYWPCDLNQLVAEFRDSGSSGDYYATKSLFREEPGLIGLGDNITYGGLFRPASVNLATECVFSFNTGAAANSYQINYNAVTGYIRAQIGNDADQHVRVELTAEGLESVVDGKTRFIHLAVHSIRGPGSWYISVWANGQKMGSTLQEYTTSSVPINEWPTWKLDAGGLAERFPAWCYGGGGARRGFNGNMMFNYAFAGENESLIQDYQEAFRRQDGNNG